MDLRIVSFIAGPVQESTRKTAPKFERGAIPDPYECGVSSWEESLSLMNTTNVTDTKPAPFTKSRAFDLEALLGGDPKAFEQLVVSESPRLFRVIVRILGDDDEAQSVLQETYLQAFQRLHTFRRESKLTTWLYAIGINLARASLRKSRRLSSLEDHDVERMQPTFPRAMYSETFEMWDPQKLSELSERRQLVHKAIAKLPLDYRTVVILRDIEEHSTDEVAKILDISGGAVRVRLHRARQALRKLLASHIN